MTSRLTTDVECDGCRDWTHGDTGYRVHGLAARREAKSVGWARRRIDGNHVVDLCPKCQKGIGAPESPDRGSTALQPTAGGLLAGLAQDEEEEP